MKALLGGAVELNEALLLFLLLPRHAKLFRWCLGEGLRAVWPMTLMSIGEYSDPRGIYVSSIL
jgi:hypothetical protein